MRAVIIGLIFAAVILAGGTAYLLRGYISSQQAEFAAMIPKAPTTSVMVAAADLPVGTAINSKNIDWQAWPEDAIQDGFLVKTSASDPLSTITKDKHVVRHAFTKGEPVIMSKLYKSDDPGFLRGALIPGMRAVAVNSNAETSAGGFVLPGDHVDVLLTHNMIRRMADRQVSADPEDALALEHTSETILQNIRILAVDQKVNEFEGGAVIAKTLLLEVTPKQAEMLNTAKSMGKLSFALRSAEPGAPRTDRPFTTDIEVSPMLSTISGADLQGISGNRQGGLPTADPLLSGGGDIMIPQTPPKAAAPQPTAPPPVTTRSFKPAKPRQDITVYRGPESSTAGTTTGASGAEGGTVQ